MKRISRPSDISSSSSIVSFEDICSSLKYLNRQQLLHIAFDTNRLLSLGCASVTDSIPEEVWQIVLKIGVNNNKNFPHKAKSSNEYLARIQAFLQRIGCVCQSWKKLSRELVSLYFEDRESYSDWVLKHFEGLSTLKYTWFGNRISKETIMNMKNLTKLVVDSRDAEVPRVDRFLKKLTNLSSLTLVSSKKLAMIV